MRSLGIDIGGTSSKLALLEDGKVLWTGQSKFYSKPDPAGLKQALLEAAAGRVDRVDRAGICVPGIQNDERTMVLKSVNVPGLNNLPLIDLIQGTFPVVKQLKVCNDAISCSTDVVLSLGLKGRVVVLAMGTGVGASVLDDGVPLLVDGESPGHIGMLDVSIGENPPLGPDGGAGGLEGYFGVPALKRAYGDDVNSTLARLTENDPCMKALARAIRICHAMFRPHHTVLAGGVGTRLREKLPILKKLVDANLTSIAREDRTLQCALNDFHAACGAARLSTR